MRQSARGICCAAALTIVLVAGSTWANVLDMPPGLTSLETVYVGNARNVADTRYNLDQQPEGFGRVDYSYRIGKCEVTAGQYCEFLNKVAKTDKYGLYHPDMACPEPYPWGCNIERSGSPGSYTYRVESGWANRPVSHVSYWDACRFANWLHNDQLTGDQGAGITETGAYTLNGYNDWDGQTIQRNADWKWAVTSEDEWYKAAYHKYDGVTEDYFDYPTGSDNVPSNVVANPDPGNNANCYHNDGTGNGTYSVGGPYFRTEAGEFENSDSPYGTFDQGGNVWEWNEAIVDRGTDYADRGYRGGAFDFWGVDLHASVRYGKLPTYEAYYLGFRVVEVPDPGSASLMLLGIFGALRYRCTK